MKLYDKIYYPDHAYGTFEVRDIDCEFPECNASQKSNVICMTMEELREIWDAAQQRMIPPHNSPSFNDILQSKGIPITNNK